MKQAKIAPEKVGEAWDEFEVAAWLGFTFLFQQSGYNFFCSSANTYECHTDHQGWWDALALMMTRMVMALRKIALMVNYFGHGLDNGLGWWLWWWSTLALMMASMMNLMMTLMMTIPWLCQSRAPGPLRPETSRLPQEAPIWLWWGIILKMVSLWGCVLYL